MSDELLAYSLKKPTINGRTEIDLTPLELLDRLSKLIMPPRVNKHRYCGVLALNANLRRAVIESAGRSGTTLQVLQEEPSEPASGDRFRKSAARCWAMLLARIYECLPLQRPKCGEPI